MFVAGKHKGEPVMNALKSLNIVALPKLSNSDPAMKRRAKLLVQLEQQLELAKDPSFVVLTHKWRKQEDGSKQLVEKQKRVKKWWVVDMMGNCFFTVRYGSKLLEFEKGKSAINVGDKEQLVAVIEAVIDAVRAGELDAVLGGVQRVGQKARAKVA
jgi:hypothetical protein